VYLNVALPAFGSIDLPQLQGLIQKYSNFLFVVIAIIVLFFKRVVSIVAVSPKKGRNPVARQIQSAVVVGLHREQVRVRCLNLIGSRLNLYR
jgi:hypothetical protein